MEELKRSLTTVTAEPQPATVAAAGGGEQSNLFERPFLMLSQRQSELRKLHVDDGARTGGITNSPNGLREYVWSWVTQQFSFQDAPGKTLNLGGCFYDSYPKPADGERQDFAMAVVELVLVQFFFFCHWLNLLQRRKRFTSLNLARCRLGDAGVTVIAKALEVSC